MNHQPFETWLVDHDQLTSEQSVQLTQHLQSCESCKQLRSSLGVVDRILQKNPLVKAPAGFANRFQASLAERREREQRRQVRNVLLGLSAALLLTSTILLIQFIAASSFAELFGNTIQWFINSTQNFLEFRYIFSFWAAELPPVAFLSVGVVFTAWALLLLVPWVLTLLRINYQGVSKE